MLSLCWAMRTHCLVSPDTASSTRRVWQGLPCLRAGSWALQLWSRILTSLTRFPPGFPETLQVVDGRGRRRKWLTGRLSPKPQQDILWETWVGVSQLPPPNEKATCSQSCRSCKGQTAVSAHIPGEQSQVRSCPCRWGTRGRAGSLQPA